MKRSMRNLPLPLWPAPAPASSDVRLILCLYTVSVIEFYLREKRWPTLEGMVVV